MTPGLSGYGRHRSRESQSAFVRGFIDDLAKWKAGTDVGRRSQSAFVRGFIDDTRKSKCSALSSRSLNPRSCAASSMTKTAFVEKAART